MEKVKVVPKTYSDFIGVGNLEDGSILMTYNTTDGSGARFSRSLDGVL